MLVMELAPRGAPPAGATWAAPAGLPDATAGPAQAEPIPDVHYGSAAVPVGGSTTTVYDRMVTPASSIFLSVDTTAWPGADLALPGLEVTVRQPGIFQVSTLDGSAAPGSGVTFTYAVFNASTSGFFTVGTGTIPVGQHNTGLSIPQASTSSAVVLTIDRQLTIPVGSPGGLERPPAALSPVPALKLNNHGSGFITVTTVDNSAPSVPIPFNWMVVNETGITRQLVNGQLRSFPYSGCRSVCGTGTVPVNAPNVGVSTSAVTPPTGVLVTPDITSYPADTAVPGLKVNNHGSGFFTVTTDRLEPVPSTATQGEPFQYVLLQPPTQWEELGPTGRSGNTWTVAADPSDPLQTWYVGSSHGGVWKTTTAGDTWYQAWYDTGHKPLPEVSIEFLKFSPSGVLYAFDLAGDLWRSADHGLTWAARGSQLGAGNAYARGLRLEVDGSDSVYGCADTGLFVLGVGASSWARFGPAVPNGGKCTDVVVDGGTVYAAFRDVGVLRLVGGQWQTVKAAFAPIGKLSPLQDDPLRIAFNSTQVAVNDNCNVWVRSRGDLAAANVASTWGSSIGGANPDGRVCDDTAGGYSAGVALAPGGRWIIANGRGAWESTDGGATFPTKLFPPRPGLDMQQTGETHQVLILSDSIAVAAVDGGIRATGDGGATWGEANTRSRQVDGPPVTEFYNLDVSNPDQFGQVLLGGAVQDIGGVGMLDRPTGLSCCTGEFGAVTVVPKPLDGSDANGNPVSTLRMIGTAYQSMDQGLPGSEGNQSVVLDVCDYTTTGAVVPAAGTAQEGDFPPGNCHNAQVFPASGSETITAVGASQQSPTSVLVGGSNGSVFRMHTDGTTFDQVVAASGDKVTAIGFAGDTLAFVGRASGRVTRISNPFGAPTVSIQRVSTATGVDASVNQPVVHFAFHYGDTQELYIGYQNQIAASRDGGASWIDLIAGFVQDVVGLVRDPNTPTLYVAFGHQQRPPGAGAWGTTDYTGGSVMATAAAPTSTPNWTPLMAGLPLGAAITGLGMAAGKALYVSTQGRGVFWRRDVAAQKPNIGVNTPEYLTTAAGGAVTITTRCSYPDGWRHIRTLDFKLARGHGPGEGEPVAVWVEFDQTRGVLRFYDPDTRAWTEGRPGAATLLSSRYASLDLARSKVVDVAGARPSTVEIDWSLTVRSPAAGSLQQYLRVSDRAGATTTWDKVGQWRITVAHHGHTRRGLALTVGGLVIGAAIGGIGFGLRRRRARGRPTPTGVRLGPDRGVVARGDS